jgi:hypothetical protein
MHLESEKAFAELVRRILCLCIHVCEGQHLRTRFPSQPIYGAAGFIVLHLRTDSSTAENPDMGLCDAFKQLENL